MADSVVRIQGGTISNQGSLVITDLSSDYFKYELTFSGLRSHTQDSYLVADLSDDNGSNYDTSYSYRMQVAIAASATVISYTDTNYPALVLVNNILNSSTYTFAGTIEIFTPMDSGSKTTLIARNVGASGDNFNAINMCSTQQNAAQADNAIRFRSHNGTTANNFSMKYVLYGYKL